MGRSISSSKRKSSKSKSSKLSHEARRKKKSKRNKSKKLLRHDDSSYSSDDSMSLSSISTSSSEASYSSSSMDDYKSRKSRSRARSDAKSKKKKSKRKSSSPERSKDPPHSKKRKRSKKHVNSRLKKKSRKTKRGRDVSISSISSDSRSCSSGEESEPERHSGLSWERKRYKRDPSKFRSKTRKTRSRSPSCSSHSRYSHHSRSVSPVMESIAAENKTRLRSVISVVEWRDEEDTHKFEKDSYKEEMVYDRDDYPSSRSNDSTDGLGKRDSAYFSNPASDKRMQGQCASGEEVTLSDLKTKDPIEDAVGCSGQVTTADNENEIGSSSTLAASGADDLELILRQKALENLRKFRGQRQVNSTANIQETKEVTSTADTVYEKSPIFDLSNTRCPATDIEKSSNPTSKRSVTHAEVEWDVSGEGKTGKDPEGNKLNDIHQLLSENSNKEKNSASDAINQQPALGTASASRQGTLGTCSAVKQATTTLSPSSSNLIETKITGNGTSSTLSPSTSTGKKLTTSGAESTSIEHKSKLDESKDGSEFEKKTMSVMRGGEMVQVSYKVYIPKKPPALHRRQLKR